MAFWFTKKEAQPKTAGAPQTPASVLAQSVSEPSIRVEEKPLLKPLAKSGAGPTLKAVPTAKPVPADSTEKKPGLKVRPKLDHRALYQQLMNGLYDAVFILDEYGNVMESNIRVEELLGYTRDEAWDLPIATIIPGMTRQLFDHLKKNISENHHVLIDSRCFRKDGTSFSGEVGVCNINFMRGNNMICSIRNIERRKTAMIDAKRFQSAVNHALCPMFICNLDSTFVTANALALEMLGIPNLMEAKAAKLIDFLPNAAATFEEAAKGNIAEGTFTLNLQSSSMTFRMALAGIKNGNDIIGVSGSVLAV